MRSDGPPLTNLDTMLWVGDIPAHWAKLHPSRPALVVPELGRETTYAELDRNRRRFVEVMHARGLRAGDRVAWVGKNNDLQLAALFGCIASGLVLVPLNWRCAAPEIAYMLADADAKLIVVDADLLPLVRASFERDPSIASIPCLASEGSSSLRELLGTPPTEEFPIRHEHDQVCVQVYTSGTTGRPKGVLCTHGGLTYARQAETVSEHWTTWKDDDVTLSPLPLFHIGGISWAIIGLIRGLTSVLTGNAAVENLLDLAERYHVTRIYVVPTLVRAILDHLVKTGRRPPRFRWLTYGAAVMSASMAAEAFTTFGCELAQYFGMTEVHGTATFLPPCDHDSSRPALLRSVGKPQAGMSLEIRDLEGRVLPSGTPGEIWVRAQTLMAGYWKLPEATANAIVDGWYRTGDGGYLDEAGYLFLTDRIRDMIVTGGENVYPAEVEDALMRHPSVAAAAVVGIPDAKWGESVVALVEPRAGCTVDPEALLAFARAEISRFKCPKAITVVNALPRTALGKIQRSEVRKTIQAKS